MPNNKKIFIGLATFAGLLYAMLSFNRETGKIPGVDALMNFKISPDSKFNIGNYFDDPFFEETALDYNLLYKQFAVGKSYDWQLLKAIAMIESSENHLAENPADPSIGLMQVLCVPDGKGGCKNKLNVAGWDGIRAESLFDPEVNLKIASQILDWNIKKYGFNKGIAVYNRWESRNESEPFSNQSYLDKVLGAYDRQF
jgi:hypothetical protein